MSSILKKKTFFADWKYDFALLTLNCNLLLEGVRKYREASRLYQIY